jgi:uncharacterized protein (TIGR02271 family)
MTTQQQAQDLIGATAYDQDGQKVGNVSTIFYDRDSGEPEWLTVKTGLFGMKENFVPLALARPRGQQEVEFATGKDAITGAPKIDPDGQLTAREEAQLFEHYGLSYGESYGEQDRGLPYGEQDSPAKRPGTGGQMAGRAGEAMTRSEERMNVGTTTEQTGRARLRKYVVTEDVQQSVPVSREEVRVEREPVTEANRDAAMSGADISEAEHEVTLHEERPVVEKEAVPVERVRLAKERVSGEETVGGEVRKERIETEGDTGSGR